MKRSDEAHAAAKAAEWFGAAKEMQEEKFNRRT